MGQGSQLAAIWYTHSKEDLPLVLFARSQDSGHTFGTPIQVAQGKTLGRVTGAMLDDGSTVVAWLHTPDDASGTLKLAQIRPDNTIVAQATAGAMSPSRGSGFPSMASDGRRALLTWTDLNKKTIRCVMVTPARR